MRLFTVLRNLGFAVACSFAISANAQTITEIELPDEADAPSRIVEGPDRNLWFTLSDGIARIRSSATAGSQTDVLLAAVDTDQSSRRVPQGITYDSSTNLIWFTSQNSGATNGYISTLPVDATTTTVPTETHIKSISGCGIDGLIPGEIVSGNNGFMYLTFDDGIIRVSTDLSECKYYSSDKGDGINSLVLGKNNDIYFNFELESKIGRFKINEETFSTYPTSGTTVSPIFDLTVGPDGDIWYTTQRHIGHLKSDNTVEEFQVTGIAAGGGVQRITAGPLGTPLWFTVSNATDEFVGQITPKGTFKGLTQVPTNASYPFDIITGPNGFLWFTEFLADNLGKIEPADILEISTSSPLPAGSVGQAYSTVFAGVEGTAPYTFSLLSANTLPPGLTLASDGTLSGTPTAALATPYKFTVEITDSELVENFKTFELTISQAILPDLSVDLRKVKFKNGVLKGTAIPTNIGPTASTASTVNFYLSKNEALDSKDKQLSSANVAAVASGQKASAINLKYTNSVAKKFKYLISCIDSANSITEQSDINNCDYERIPGR